MKRALFWIVAAAAVVAVVGVSRVALQRSRQVAPMAIVPLEIDSGAAAQRLAGSLRLRTVSNVDPGLVEWEQFALLREYLEDHFPNVHRSLAREIVGEHTLLYTWTGTDPALKPVILLAHQDVVPVEPGTESKWTHPPFEGTIADGFLWGRGALDDKANVLGILEAAERLLQLGFQPRRSLLFVFGHDEEVGGPNGARRAAALLAERGVQAEMVVDEGGAIVSGSIPGVRQPVALIGTAEKGSLSLAVTAEAEGGHSSTPPDHTAIGIVASAVHNIESHQMPMHLRGPARRMIDYLGPELPFLHRLVLANLWLFQPVIEGVAATQPTLAATLRTTTAANIIHGGVKENVLPASARAVINFRILPGDTIADVIEHTRVAVNDTRVRIEALPGAREASPDSPTDGPAFALLQTTIREIFPNALASPFLVLGGTDSRHFTALTPHIYRFTAIEGDPSAVKRIHGTDERIAVDNYTHVVQFFARLMQRSSLGEAAR